MVIHTVKGLVIVNKAEIDAFLELSCFFNDPADVGNLPIHKKNEIMSFTAKWMDLEIVILSEVSQTEKINVMVSLICGILKKGTNQFIYK